MYEIDQDSHQQFIDIFSKRHFKGEDKNQLTVNVTGFARDFYANDRSSHVNRFEFFAYTLLHVMRTAEKLRKDNKIGRYAEIILISRSIELAFFGKHHLLF
jgi:hypothetical protein